MHARASGAVYNSPRLAAGYAFRRPPVHERILAAAVARLGLTAPVARALDVGCGAGASTAALQPYAHTTIGLEPAAAMLAHTRQVAPRSCFVTGRAEELPFCNRSFDVIAAAGAINYADVPRFLGEVVRTLVTGGVLLLYDFSRGRWFADSRSAGVPPSLKLRRTSSTLHDWNRAFDARYPSAGGYHLDVTALDYARAGAALDAFEELSVTVPMTRDAYLEYVMSETSVELALARGLAEEDVRGWCRETLDPVFGGPGARDVRFDAYVAYVRTDSSRR